MSFGQLGRSFGSFGAKPGGISIASDAAQTTAFLARTSGLSGTETAAYKALINGLVSDGTFSLLDALYIFATNTTTTANLNLISTSFGITTTAAPTFTADQGYTGNGTTQFLNTNFTPGPSTGHQYTVNAASLGVYIRGGRTTPNNALTAIGTETSNVGFSLISPLEAASLVQVDINGASFPNVSLPSSTANGFVSAVRTSSSALAVYKNASATALGTPASSGTVLSTQPIYILAYNANGSAANFDTDQISAAYIGGLVTGAQHVLLSNRINTYMTTLGINVY